MTRTGSSRRRQSKNGEQPPPPPRAALHDITNDSPIVGLGHDGTLQASAAGKTRARPPPTPGSREALLCGQVKTLLQKVDEEVVMPVRIHVLLGVSRSPAQLLAPMPANTPQLGVESAAAARGEPMLPDGIKMAMSCVLEEEETLPKLQPAG